MRQKYVYGVVQTNKKAVPKVTGLGGSPVSALAQEGLSCFLSEYCGPEFETLSKEEVLRSLFIHQAVVEEIMQEHTVLPLKFGTLMDGEDEVLSFLSQGRHRLVGALARLQNRVEVEVAATWDTNQVLRELAGQEDIARARTAISTMPPGKAVQYQIRFGQMLKEAMDRRRDSYQEEMLAFLKPVALEVQANALVSDQMVMNVAFLLNKDWQQAFDDRISHLNDLFQNQINFRIIGPLPPYSFATVEVGRPNWERVEAARQFLKLGDSISEPQIRKAYRRLAAETHPDLNPGNGTAGEHWAKIKEASETLLAYCRGLASLERAGGSFPITREEVEHSLLIKINRPACEEVEESRFGGSVGQTGYTASYVSSANS